MAGKKRKTYDDFELCKDLAKGELSKTRIADKYGLSEGMISQIVLGTSRPELMPMIEKLSKEYVNEARRACRGQVRGAINRLLEFAKRDDKLGLQAVIKLLEVSDLLTQEQQGSFAATRQQIQIILSDKPTSKTAPKNRFTGVVTEN
ncbi:hypothetical protein LCGC14_0817600 [marine sediment metagenome]|uniref:Uncharacterized protein n=1 Tax=marine sediment metagenome TaxID=412755 RepID=A0A0F9PPG6_9ZZZZ